MTGYTHARWPGMCIYMMAGDGRVYIYIRRPYIYMNNSRVYTCTTARYTNMNVGRVYIYTRWPGIHMTARYDAPQAVLGENRSSAANQTRFGTDAAAFFGDGK